MKLKRNTQGTVVEVPFLKVLFYWLLSLSSLILIKEGRIR